MPPPALSPQKINERILEIQNNVKDIWRSQFSDENYMFKWLKARDFDVKKSETMLRNHINWREREKIDTILEDFQIPEVFDKYGVGSFCGHDKEGRPIWMEPLGFLDPQGFLKSLPLKDIYKVRVHIVEDLYKNILPQRSKEEGRQISQTIALFDMENFGLKHLWRPAMECTIETTKLMEANYPESMAKLIIFNTPPLFKIAYNLVKPFLQHATQQKVSILGSNYKEELLKIIDSDQLPAYLGGNMYGPNEDPRCSHLIRWGGQIPISFYLNKHVKNIQNITVKAKSKVKLSYFVSLEESVIYYEFSTKEHDINFGVYYVGPVLESEIHNLKASQLEEVLKLNKVRSNLTIEKGEIPAPKIGYYMIEFDNSYSWVKSKHLQYFIEILDIMKIENRDSKKNELI